MLSGVIIKGIGGFYYVKIESEIYECKAKGIFRRHGDKPLPGDRVQIQVVDTEKLIGNIEQIEPRLSELKRPAVANVNQIAIITALKHPEPDLMLVDKLIISAQKRGIKPIVCLNKIELDDIEASEMFSKEYMATGYEILCISAKQRVGLNELRNHLKGNITVFAGQSGVGKSTILNNIFNEWIMETGDISDKIKRGKHTTRHAQLIELEDGGYVVDSPGFSSFELDDLHHSELEKHYPEFNKYIGECRFNGCSHISEPGCIVKNAVDSGEISTGRYNRYINLYKTLESEYKNRYR